MTQENVKSLGNVYYKATDINTSTALDLYDTGRQLVVASAVAAITVTLPPIADVMAGWTVQITFASDHQHVVSVALADAGTLFGLGSAAAGNQACVGTSATLNAGTTTGSVVEVFCDGSLWHFRGDCPTGWTMAQNLFSLLRKAPFGVLFLFTLTHEASIMVLVRYE